MKDPNTHLLFITLVHPDLLPPIYAAAQVVRDLGFHVTVVCSDSTVNSNTDIGENINIISCGKYIGQNFTARGKVRKSIKAESVKALKNNAKAIVSFCPFSYLLALQIGGSTPVIYNALEVANYSWTDFKRSPLTAVRNYRAINAIHKAALVATPTIQRSAWLAGRANVNRMPFTIQNTVYYKEQEADAALFKQTVPHHFQGKTIMLYTGAINATLGVLDLVKGFDLLADENCCLILTRVSDNAYCNELKAFVAASKLSANILLLPNVPREVMLALQQNANIGITFAREIYDLIETQMIAPNKIGEYLFSGLYLVGSDVVYMRQFEEAGIASLARSLDKADIADALRNASQKFKDATLPARIRNFTRDYYCMQHQLKPITDYLQQL